MKRHVFCMTSVVLMLFLLSGCGFKFFRSAEELYTRPQLPQDYQKLEDTINMVKSEKNMDDTTPTSGSNPSAIQLLDLDSDGSYEAAAAFFRANAVDDSKPLKIYLFRKIGDGDYNIAYILEGEGNNIDSISYEDMDADGRKEVVVSWQLTARANVLSVYRLGMSGAEELIHVTYNEGYILADLDGNGNRELSVIQRDDTGEDISRVDYYSFQDGVLTMTSRAGLSENVQDVLAVRSGTLVGQTPALYVTSECTGGQVTDIFVYRDEKLVNITMNAESGVSNDTLRDYTEVSATDINHDDILEIPVALALPKVNPESTATYRLIYWRQFNGEGEASVACITYHSVEDKWYLILPNEWDGQIAVERDTRENDRGERAVIFYHRDSETGTMERFLTIYRLTGSNLAARAKLGSRQLLWPGDGEVAETSVVYAAEFAKDGWDCGLTIEQLRERFSLIVTEWSAIS